MPSQFVKGRSDNPKGCPKGSKNIATMFDEIARQTVTVHVNDRMKNVTRLEAAFLLMTDQIKASDPKMMREFV